MNLSTMQQKQLLQAQKNEITEHYIYERLAGRMKNENNAAILHKIAREEKNHYHFLETLTHCRIRPNRIKAAFYIFISRAFGLTFGVKLMERGEGNAQYFYRSVSDRIPQLAKLAEDEEAHENDLIHLIDEDGLRYISSVVLGLNDALVELTGALAGFTLSIQNSKTIALLGLITGISASFSMAASEYLSSKTEADEQVDPAKAAVYTGIAYVLTVIILVLPFFLIANYVVSLIVTMASAVIIIFIFNFYISVTKDYPFRRRFIEMAVISVSVAAVSFFIGYLVKQFLGFDL